ncbi:B3 domain-containing protein Os03g0212300-like [Rhodamnia argentea]|uniref:B3 domain-containing protein Os03g0212300-like n=1 Tax=Rhodamnia argentea TaxID=178133 RepID=A0ABM3HTI9_9MYRT|nr:B3 domain-containing protein Os03g0212300-like [Rhodamnia argentea]
MPLLSRSLKKFLLISRTSSFVNRTEMDGKRRSSRTRFFKVLIHDDFNTRLRIPPAFVVNHLPGLIIPKRFKLTNCARRSWHVDIEKVDDGLFFTRGWKAFAQDNSLQFGDFLVFKFNGASRFYVRAYGLHACEKEVPPFARKRKRGESALIEANNPTADVGGEERGVFRSFGPNLKHEDTDSVPEPDKDAEETLIYMDVNGVVHACFNVVITSNSLQYLRMPWQFIKDYIGTGKQTAELQYADRSWLVRLRVFPSFQGGFYEGWTAFAKSNNLLSGDACLFELIDGEEIVFKVSVHTNVML